VRIDLILPLRISKVPTFGIQAYVTLLLLRILAVPLWQDSVCISLLAAALRREEYTTLDRIPMGTIMSKRTPIARQALSDYSDRVRNTTAYVQ